jgi:hypothetical protein
MALCLGKHYGRLYLTLWTEFKIIYAGLIDRAVWGEGLGCLDAEIVDSTPA